MTRTLPLLLARIFLVGGAYAQDSAQHIQHPDPHASGPQTILALDNDAVQVARIHLDPHEEIPMHDVTPRVVVWLTEAHLRATLPDGKTRDERDRAIDFTAVIPKTANRAR